MGTGSRGVSGTGFRGLGLGRGRGEVLFGGLAAEVAVLEETFLAVEAFWVVEALCAVEVFLVLEVFVVLEVFWLVVAVSSAAEVRLN